MLKANKYRELGPKEVVPEYSEVLNQVHSKNYMRKMLEGRPEYQLLMLFGEEFINRSLQGFPDIESEEEDRKAGVWTNEHAYAGNVVENCKAFNSDNPRQRIFRVPIEPKIGYRELRGKEVLEKGAQYLVMRRTKEEAFELIKQHNPKIETPDDLPDDLRREYDKCPDVHSEARDRKDNNWKNVPESSYGKTVQQIRELSRYGIFRIPYFILENAEQAPVSSGERSSK